MDLFERTRALFLQALEHHNTGRFAEAEPLYRQAMQLMPERVSVLVNLSAVLLRLQQVDEARALCDRALALEPGNADALSIRAQCSRVHSSPEQTLVMLDRLIAADPGDADAHNNRGVVLRDLGRLHDALASYANALALDADHLGALSNRASVLARLGYRDEALSDYRRALKRQNDFAPAGQGFIHLVLESGHAPTHHDAEFDALVVRALETPWARPITLVPLLTRLLRADAEFNACLTHVADAGPDRARLAAVLDRDLHLLLRKPLLLALLRHAMVVDVAIERLLCALREHVLRQAMCQAPPDWSDDALSLYCALATQCLVNEFVWAVSPSEVDGVLRLRERVVAALDDGRSVALPSLVALASHEPLHRLPDAGRLSVMHWPHTVRALLALHVDAPLTEQQWRARIPTLTAIDDHVSIEVQRQYEENPYPRWFALVRADTPVPLRDYVRNRVPGCSWTFTRETPVIHALNAGCGTGQQPIDTAMRVHGVQVLGIDLSMASLAYAARMAHCHGIDNVRFMRADLLERGSLTQRFDLIESTGVLHHMADPLAGMCVLASLLREDGILRVALYSESARRSVVAARALIAERGFTASADDIRRCRSEIIALEDGALAKRVIAFSDFHSVSECRDLLFHACEHRFTLSQIRQLLLDAGLRLVGFELEPSQHAAFALDFPDPAALTDFDAWIAYEADHPEAFVEMIKFWTCLDRNRQLANSAPAD
ncbi:MAG: methyltransferase domain-containing protein [Dokdonella sp.]